jgi:iron complex outermembrane receptor protein
MNEGWDMKFADVARRSLALVAASLATMAHGEDAAQSGKNQLADSAAGAIASTSAATADAIPRDSAETSAQTSDAGLAEVIVTAQKREQRANDVGMSITALGAGELQDRGVTSVAELAKVVPGFIYSPTSYSNPVYSIRGIGFYESSLAVTPAVTVYVDEVPLPYPAMTSYADLDLERVEVLKGPQGTVFGQNATGGAVNYIAKKPTDQFAAGYNVSYERFNAINIGGFAGGPINDTLSVRVAARAASGGAWQTSDTREDELGNQDWLQARVLLDFHPTDRLDFLLNINGWRDKSDPQAPQVIAYFPPHPDNPAVAVISKLPTSAPADARDADWNPGFPRRDNNFHQVALRGTYKLTDDVSLTSISAYEQLSIHEQNDDDGFAVHLDDTVLGGGITSYSQELRLGGQQGRFNWLLGANYSHDKSRDTEFSIFDYTSNNPTFPGFTPPLSTSLTSADGRARTAAGFANLEYQAIDTVTLQAGARYTDDNRHVSSCFAGDAALSQTFEFIENLLKGSVVPIPAGGCVTLDDTNPANLFNPSGPIDRTLHQHNVSWRGGVNWKVNPQTLWYANVSKGYKAGAFPTLPYEFSSQAKPVTQESVLAYETGFKAALFDRHAQLNGAAFYYDYTNKQLHAKVLNAIFGALDSLQNIPKSRLWGAELQLNAVPAKGLDLNVGLTYLNSEIMHNFVTFPQFGPQVNVGGNPFPYTPKFIAVSDGQYRWNTGASVTPFVGAGITYNSPTTGDIGNAPQYRLRSFTVLDARVGLIGSDDRWRLALFGRNITNAYYWTAAYTFGTEEAVRIAARPVTYGVSFNMNF